jgi:2,4-dienoyl-CoA reductase-like NADH-dependent reductase (Old Yellow Enzyme family)/thioredoxin reductase
MIGGNDPLGGFAPSVVDIPLYRDKWGRGDIHKPKELSNEQIYMLIEDFAQGARRAKEAGFDGVEVHAAYGYLISEFICPATNRRSDEFGGSFENRMRFPVEIIRRIKKVCGDEYPIGFKFNMHMDIQPSGIDEEMGLKIASRIARENVAYLHEVAMGEDVMVMALGKYPSMPTIYQPRNTTLPLAEYLKMNLSGVPVIAAGGILTPEDAEKIISEGSADMVAIGRALLADPHWSLKAKEGKRITPCIKCLVCHNEVVKRAKIAACSVNPYLCREKDAPLIMARVKKKVMVAGAGPSGITAALAASRRGHDVSLFEKSGKAGGMLICSTVPDFKYEFDTLIDFYIKELEESNVALNLNSEVNEETIRKQHPDVMVIAIGGVAVKPSVEGIDLMPGSSAVDLFLKNKIPEGKNIVIIGGGEVGCEAALWLRRNKKNVFVVELLDELMALEEMKYHTMVLGKMLAGEGVIAYTGSKVKKIIPGNTIVEKQNGEIFNIESDFIVYAAGFATPEEKIKSFNGLTPELYVIGDARGPGKIREAVHEGDRIGRLI